MDNLVPGDRGGIIADFDFVFHGHHFDLSYAAVCRHCP
jgi:hypothetical protein